jgi:hypothetical protein
MKTYNHNNGELVSNVIAIEIQKFINKMAKKYPNDYSLGEAIRKLKENE